MASGENCFNRLFAEHYRPGYRLALALCGEPALAEDCTSEAFLGVWRQWQAGRVEDFSPYLRKAIVNEVHRTFRTRALERHDLERRARQSQGDVAGAEASIGDRDVLVAAMAKLPLGQRAAVALRYLYDLSEADTASALGVSTGTVKRQLWRGLARLQALLAGEARS